MLRAEGSVTVAEVVFNINALFTLLPVGGQQKAGWTSIRWPLVSSTEYQYVYNSGGPESCIDASRRRVVVT